ncbi:hypothetical protein JCM11251_003081 [Rhodosporidiobolus azoricus]
MANRVNTNQQDGNGGRKRNRKIASCNPCRARRIRCDRGHPCQACVSRKDSCIWDVNALAPLYERREAQETERLRDEVDRLQRLVDVLVSAHPLPESGALPAVPPPPYPFSNDEGKLVPPKVAGNSTATEFPFQAQHQQQNLPEELHALEAEDLVKRLSELTIKTFQLGREESPDPHGQSLVKEAQYLLDVSVPVPKSDGPPCNSTSIPDFLSLLPATSTPNDTLELVGRLPPKQLLDKAVDAHFSALSWYHWVLTRKQYQAHEDLVYAAKAEDRSAPPSSLAIVFSICALGLFGCDPDLPPYGGYAKTDLAVALVELAKTALAIGRFLEHPSLDALRALITLAMHYCVLAPGDDGGCGMGLLALSVNACLQLELHRDPDRLANLSFGAKEDRRRLFWTVYLKDVEISSVMGRRFTLLHLRDTDCKLPLDLDDDELEQDAPMPSGEETVMSALLARMKIAKLTAQTTDEVFGIHPVTYTRILELDGEIRKLARDLPDIYQVGTSSNPLTASKALVVTLALLQEVMRLHRPFLARSFFDEKFAFSRTACVNTARRVLELQQSPLLQASWACMIYKGISASTILCIDLMYEPGNPSAKGSQELIGSCVERLERFKGISTISRRGAALLRFLLDKIDAASRSFRMMEDEAPRLKRSRTAPTGTLSNLTDSPQMSNLPRPESELAHKLPKASSFSSTSSTRFFSSLPIERAGPRTTHPYPLSRSKSDSSSTSSCVPSLEFPRNASTSRGGEAAGSEFSSAISSLAVSTSLPNPTSMRSAADEIASLDFPALLGLDGNAAPFSFDFGFTSFPASSSAASASSVMPKMGVNGEAGTSPSLGSTGGGQDGDYFHDGVAWGSPPTLDSLSVPMRDFSSRLFTTDAPSVRMDEPLPFDTGGTAPAGRQAREDGGGGQASNELWEGSHMQQQIVGRRDGSEWADWLRGI